MKEITVSGKHFKSRLIIVIALLVVAVASFVIAFVSIGNNEEGYYVITASNNTEYPLYGKGISATLYFKGNSNDIKAQVNNATDVLSNSLKDSYILTNEKATHGSYYDIADINTHPNEEITINAPLYNLLQEYLAKTEEKKNYSIYSASLYDYWDVLFSLSDSDKETQDPKNNDVNRLFLEKLVGYTKEEHIKLNLLEDNKVRLFVSEEYLNFRSENSVTSAFVSLNVLKDAYRAEKLAEALKNAQLTSGYVSTSSGISIFLNTSENPTYQLYDRYEGSNIKYALVLFTSPSSATSLKRFSMESGEYQPYYVLQDGTVRHSVLNISTGYPDQTYQSSTVLFKNSNVVESYYQNNYFSTLTVNEVKDALNAYTDDISYIYTLRNEEKKCYITNNLNDKVVVNSVIGYVANEI